MRTSGTNRKVRVLLNAIKDGTLIPRPEFQRRLVWTNKHKQEFVKTVLMEYPFPEIYIAAGEVNPDTSEGNEMLVDGQQRITTLYQYFTGSPDLRLGDVRPYSKLNSNEKVNFLEYEVVVRDLGKKSIEEIREVFTRINSTKYSLNAMEIHNARFDGAFKEFAEEITQHQFFEDHMVFRTNDIRRMGDMVFCLAVIITVLSTYFHRDNELEDYLEKYNDEFPHADETRKELSSTFNFIDKCEIPNTCRAWKKADLFTLLVEVYRVLFRDKIKLSLKEVGKRLNEFYKLVDKAGTMADENEEISRYYKASLQATNDRSSRIARGQVLRKVLIDEL